MSKVADLAYDIEQLYIEGHSPRVIAVLLECPVEMVFEWLEQNNVDEAEEFSPFDTVNS